MLEKVKLALRISHNLLDEDIKDTIKAARAEMIRSGVNESVANCENSEIINQAIKTYCFFVYANDTKMQDGYFKSWEYQLDNIRKSTIDLPQIPEMEGETEVEPEQTPEGVNHV